MTEPEPPVRATGACQGIGSDSGAMKTTPASRTPPNRPKAPIPRRPAALGLPRAWPQTSPSAPK